MKYAVALPTADDIKHWCPFATSSTDIEIVVVTATNWFGVRPVQITRAADGETLFRRRNGREHDTGR